MLFTNESTERSTSRMEIIREKLLHRISGWIPRPGKRIVRSAIGVAAYLLLCLLLQRLAPDFHLAPQVWSWNLAGGLSFAFLIEFGVAYAPVIFVAYLIPLFADGSAAISVWLVISFAAGNAAVFGLASYVAHRKMSRAHIDLEDRKALIVVLGLIPFASFAAALFSTLVWWFADVLLPGTLMEALLIKTFSNGMGLFLVAPFFLLIAIPLLNFDGERFDPFEEVETAVLTQGAILVHSVVGSVVAISIFGLDRFETYLLLFAPLTAMALRFELRGLAAGFMLVACTQRVMTFFGYRSLDGVSMETTVLLAMVSTLVIATVTTERNRAMNTAQRLATLILNAGARTARETLRTPGQEHDPNEPLRDLVREVQASDLHTIESDEIQAEHDRIIERLQELSHPLDSNVGKKHSLSTIHTKTG